jgi:8-oxo-dGTP pyrophosphatase MutT (NUDIX family)
MAEKQNYRRRSARVLLVDGRDRLLLLRTLRERGKPERGYVWMTPGGGVKRHESLEQAAARELAEEIGLVVNAAELGLPVAQTSGYAELKWASGMFRDDFFYHRVDSHEVSSTGLEDYEQELEAGHHWWSVAELTTTTETIYPWGLTPLLARLISNGAPKRPVQLPWHH